MVCLSYMTIQTIIHISNNMNFADEQTRCFKIFIYYKHSYTKETA
jgi:hypothetical protein